MRGYKAVFFVIFMMVFSSTFACRYTIREIGFSTLSKVTYVIYRVDENTAQFPKQLALGFAESNVKTFGLNVNSDVNNPVVNFVKAQNSSLPAYVLADPNGQMLILSENQINVGLKQSILSSPIQDQMVKELAFIYGKVLLIEGSNQVANEIAWNKINTTCERIENIMPNMPKQVEFGPNISVISKENFEEEKVLLWSLGIKNIPEQPVAFVVYGRGRIIGEKVDFEEIKGESIYKLLSIIGADCECGLDRKWMLGYQVPLNWPKDVRQDLSDKLDFDVDNPMVLAEMSRILAIENKIAADPDGISFEPTIIDLEAAFNDVPVIDFNQSTNDNEDEFNVDMSIVYSLLLFVVLIIVAGFFVIKNKKSNF